VYLTFDDGPDPDYTPRLLDVLREHRARATFFVVGQKCAKHPEILQRIVAEGHSIGNHTFSHVDAKSVARRDYLREIIRTEELLQQTVGKRSRLFRPPYGRLTLGTLLSLMFWRRTIALWNVDVRDHERSTLEIQRWLAQNTLRDGDIVLMHDVRPQAAEIVPAIIRDANAHGLSCHGLEIDTSRRGLVQP
jgi:peptidoglycan/xylan/chitin deacetylase (PgdA/CDA1 family)